MAPESTFCTIVLALNLLAPPAPSPTRDIPNGTTSAFRTDGLSPRQLRLWNAIGKVVLAMDHHGSPRHPTLYQLWRTVERSGYRVVVELMTDKKRASNVAAECTIEKLNIAEHNHTIRLTLFIPSIDRAYAQQQAPQDGLEFVPFSGLRGKSRYAKVLGHELAHIAQAVNDPDYLRLFYEICTEQRIIAAGVGEDGKQLSGAALQGRCNRVWSMVLELEKPALAAETEIWRELLRAKKQEWSGNDRNPRVNRLHQSVSR